MMAEKLIPIEHHVIRTEEDMERFADRLFPERIVERQADQTGFLSGFDLMDEPSHPGHPSNYGDDE